MNPAVRNVLPPSYNEVIRTEHDRIGPVRNWHRESDPDWQAHQTHHQYHNRPYSTDCQKLFHGADLEEISRQTPIQLQRSESKSSCSSGGSSNWAVNGGNLAEYTNADIHSKMNKDLPAGWKISFTTTGRLYYTHLATDTNHWNHPLEKTDLPPGWERILFKNDYGQYYVNHITKTAQFDHPGTQINPISGEEHAHALAVVKLRQLHQDKTPSSTYVPPSQYLTEEIPMWLHDYALSSHEEYEWSAESDENLDKYQTMMTRLYREELRHLIQEYEGYRNKIIKELEERMQAQDLQELNAVENNSNISVVTSSHLETFV